MIRQDESLKVVIEPIKLINGKPADGSKLPDIGFGDDIGDGEFGEVE